MKCVIECMDPSFVHTTANREAWCTKDNMTDWTESCYIVVSAIKTS